METEERGVEDFAEWRWKEMKTEWRLELSLILVIAFASLGFLVSPYLDKVASEKATSDHAIYTAGVSEGVNIGANLGSDGYTRCLYDFKGNYFCNESTVVALDNEYKTVWTASINATIYITPGRNVIISDDGSYYFAQVK